MFFLPPQNGGRVKLSLMFGTITFMLRKETKCVFFWEAKTISKMWRICLNFYPPQNMLFWGSKSSFCLPPTQKKWEWIGNTWNFVTKNLQLLKNSTGPNSSAQNLPCFGSVPTFRGTRKNPPKTSRNGIDGPPWAMIYIRAQKSWAGGSVGNLFQIWVTKFPMFRKSL